MPDLALDDLRVLDLSQGIAGPFCAKLLADYGAEVIKIEPPTGGDYARRLGPFPEDIPDHDRAGLFLHLNTNKKSVTLDIGSQSGRIILRKLLAKADVLVESYPPGYLAGLTLGYEDLKAELPALIYCSITPFGLTGPYRHYKGNSLACLALSGLMYVTGDPDREPLATGGEPAEYFAAITAWVAILAALAQRGQTGQGQHIDVSMLEALGAADEYNTMMYAGYGAIRRRYYSRHLFMYPADIFPCQDGHIAIISGPAGYPTSMALLLENPDLETNALLSPLPWVRTINWRQFNEMITPYLLSHTWQDLLTRAQELRLPFAPVLDPKTLLENEHLRERRLFLDIDHPEVGSLPYPGAPFRMGESPMRAGRAPLLGEHTQEVLLELGYETGDTVILRERGIT